MDRNELLARGFEAHRGHLRSVAYRMLGSLSEADDAVQESWLRLSRADTSGVENLRGWLTTVVGRVCLDMLRSRTSRREDPLPDDAPLLPGSSAGLAGAGLAGGRGDPGDPEHQAELADSVGLALLVVLETLSPAERLAFVLHDLFAVPFDEIAAIAGRSPAAVRQLASRARRRIQGSEVQSSEVRGSAVRGPAPDAGRARQRAVVEAFLDASRNGNFDALLALLDPDAVVRVDGTAAGFGAERADGAQAVAVTFSGRAQAAELALIDGAAGAVWAPGGQPRVVFGFTLAGGRIARIDILADPAVLGGLHLEFADR
jgi:RNA polymerase sigma-70 factor (ECF subfamily)